MYAKPTTQHNTTDFNSNRAESQAKFCFSFSKFIKFSSRFTLHPSRSYGFTIAEVLITLCVVGIVAAFLIPMVTANARKLVVEERLKKFYSTINQAVQQSEFDNGPKENWDTMGVGAQALAWYTKYLANYLVSTKPPVFYMNSYVLYFSDGSLLIFGNNYGTFYPNAKDFPNGDGATKSFLFYFEPGGVLQYHKNKGWEPYKMSWDGTRNHLRNHAGIGCNPTATKYYCTAFIQTNNWKIPDDYLFNF